MMISHPHKVALWLLLLLLLAAQTAVAQTNSLPLSQAVADDIIQLEISGRNIAYTQPMLLLRLTNQTTHPLTIQLAQGQQLASQHPQYANLILLQNETIPLPPGETTSHTVYAYSLNADLAFPPATITYSPDSPSSSPDLLTLLQRIEAAEAEATLSAQLAVWMQLAATTDFDRFVTRFGPDIDLQPQRRQTLQLLGAETAVWSGWNITAVLLPTLLIIATLLLWLRRHLRKTIDGYQLITHLATGVKYHIQQAYPHSGTSLLAIKQPITASDEPTCLHEVTVREQIPKEAPHIVPLLASGYTSNSKNSPPRPYLVEKYIDGADLGKLIAERQKLGTTLGLEIISQLSSSLTYLHTNANIIHGALKPSNILIDRRGQLWLTDFSAALVPTNGEEPAAGQRHHHGQQAWTAPELSQPPGANGHSPPAYDERADIFSLGVLLYQLATGRLPFITTSPTSNLSLRPNTYAGLEPRLALALRQCLATDPNGRFQSITALQQALGLPLPAEDARRAQAELGRIVQDVMPAVKST